MEDAPTAKATTGLSNSASAGDFTQQQIHGLIQRIFSPGWPKASRHVVVSSVDAETNIAPACGRIVCEMATALPGTVCAMEADPRTPVFANLLQGTNPDVLQGELCDCVRVGKNLWLAHADSLIPAGDDALSAVCLRDRLNEFRRNFDYALIHAPAAFLARTIVLGQLTDGLILAIQAGKTRRAVAETTLETLKAANVSVLGAILIDRTFPIPEKLYSRL